MMENPQIKNNIAVFTFNSPVASSPMVHIVSTSLGDYRVTDEHEIKICENFKDNNGAESTTEFDALFNSIVSRVFRQITGMG
jgi:hypothetical protein